MADTLKIISEALEKFENLGLLERHQTLQDLKKFANIEPLVAEEADSVCPVHKETLRLPCGLATCKFWVDQPWTKNCALNFMLAQKKEKLTVEQVSLLYRKSPRRVESIYKRSFKIVQRHYLRDTLRTRGVPQFKYIPGFCPACETKIFEDEPIDPALSLGHGHSYCSPECKKQHPPQYFEVEKFFESEFLQVVRVGSELFNFFALEDLLGFQPNVLRNRLEKLREETQKKEA